MSPIFSKETRAILVKNLLGGLVFAAAALLILFVPLPQAAAAPTQRTIHINASRFQFMPGQIQVNPGDRVTIELTSQDVVHGLSLDNYNFELRAEPGQTATGTFIANQTGVFRFRCSFTCGNLHPFMIGELTVGTNSLLPRGIALAGLAILAAFVSYRVAVPLQKQGTK
jgi:cytochrome c oxidase subunit II